MSPLAIDKRDVQFCLFEYLKVDEMSKYPRYKEINRELLDMVVDEATKFSLEVLGPINTVLDRNPPQFENGQVTVPQECKDAYKKFCEGGWLAPSGSPEYGGQGLPLLMNSSSTEIQGAGCMPFLMCPGLTRAAGHVVEIHGTDKMRELYLEKLYSGEWGGTMCLTESSAGTAVGDLKSKARKDGDHYLVEGEKIFISFGDHDLTDNIIHLVLARTEGAPKGIKGISLFLVPKFLVNDDGSIGEPNNVTCGNIEHKMGIVGSPTCTMLFGADGPCRGWLIGEENLGIRFMFQMMNEARIGVGLQGLSQAAASYQEALQYAKDRVQGVDMKDMKDVDAPRVPIIHHPDVKRMLLTMKAFVEGMRMLLYYTTKCADLTLCSEDEEEKAHAQHMLDLLTPICKAYSADRGFEMTTLAIQIFGGYGYCKEYPVEQYCRDAKIASIYEGTNGVQALDLLGRKVAGKGGAAFMTFLNHLNGFIDGKKDHPVVGPYVAKLESTRDKLTQAVMHFQKVGMEGDFYYPLAHATPFMDMFGTMVVCYFLTDMAVLASEKLDAIYEKAGASDDAAKRKVIEENPEANYYDGKLHSMRFFADTYLPYADSICETILSGNRSALDINF
jgi:alkylation response protein AidB-like acyl-CoA dehydrogenase